MRRQECEDCNCLKSEHRKYKGKDLCYGCWQVFKDSAAVYFDEIKTGHVDMWHKFKLNNLKWLEEQYEKTL